MTQRLAVKCPECKTVHKVDSSHRGKRIRCQGCSKTLGIPALPATRSTGDKLQTQAGCEPPPSSTSGETGSHVSAAVLDELSNTKKWARRTGYLWIVGLIGTAISLVPLGLQAIAAVGDPTPTARVIGGVISVLLAVVFVRQAMAYAGAIDQLEESGSTDCLVNALQCQRRFWALQGLVLLVLPLCLLGAAAALLTVQRFL